MFLINIWLLHNVDGKQAEETEHAGQAFCEVQRT